MPGSLSNYAENVVLDTLLAGTTYVGLFTDAAAMSTDQPSTEMVGTGYARQAVTHAAASGGVKATNAAVTFTAGGAWPTANYVGVWSASTGGNLLYWASCSAETLANTNTLTIASGALSINGD